MERDEKIMKKMVTDIVTNNEKVLDQQQVDTNKFSKIVPTLLKKGLDNINLSMFSPELKFSILTALGEGYKRKGNLNDAVKSFVLAGNREKLNEVAKDYERLLQFHNCIEGFKMADNKEKLLDLGSK